MGFAAAMKLFSSLESIATLNQQHLVPRPQIQNPVHMLRCRHKIVPLSWIHFIFWSIALSYALIPKIQCICMVAAMLLTTTPKLLASLQQPRAKQNQKLLKKRRRGNSEGGGWSDGGRVGSQAGDGAGGQARDRVSEALVFLGLPLPTALTSAMLVRNI
jgi:uncharacterized membrane protein YgcG